MSMMFEMRMWVVHGARWVLSRKPAYQSCETKSCLANSQDRIRHPRHEGPDALRFSPIDARAKIKHARP